MWLREEPLQGLRVHRVALARYGITWRLHAAMPRTLKGIDQSPGPTKHPILLRICAVPYGHASLQVGISASATTLPLEQIANLGAVAHGPHQVSGY